MGSPVIQLLILAGIAVFLIIKLRSLLGTRDGFEKPHARVSEMPRPVRSDVEETETEPAKDFTRFVKEGTYAEDELRHMHLVGGDFDDEMFIEGAKKAYEWILGKFTRGDLSELNLYLSNDVFESFEDTITERRKDGLTREVELVGFRKVSIVAADFDEKTFNAEIKVEFVSELISYATNAEGEVVEGSKEAVQRQTDVWTFARNFEDSDPNWMLVETGA